LTFVTFLEDRGKITTESGEIGPFEEGETVELSSGTAKILLNGSSCVRFAWECVHCGELCERAEKPKICRNPNCKSKKFRSLHPTKHHEIAEVLRRNRHYLTIDDSEELYIYKDGRYCNEIAESTTKAATDELKPGCKSHFQNEVLEKIKSRTYIPRQKFGLPKEEIACENGILNLKTKELREHTPDKPTSVKIPVNFFPNKKCPKIQDFLHDILADEDIPVIQEFVGYCLWKDYPFHKALMLTGGGSNGKTKFLNLVRRFLGKENVSSPSLQDILYNRFAKADLYGKLANIHADLPNKKLGQAGQFKMLVGQDQIYAEKKHRNAFHFDNYAKLMFSANEIPESKDKSRAFYRRWIIVDFPYKFKDNPNPDDPYEKKKDPNVLDKIITEEELSGFLNWAIEGLHRLLENGEFSEKMTISEREDMWERMSDPIKAFAEECLEMNPNERETKDDIYAAYAQFCRERKVPIKDKNVFAREVPKKLGLEPTRPRIANKRTPCWKGATFERRVSEEEGKGS